MALIQEVHRLEASNTDILAAPSRLSSIPRGGVLTLELSSTHCDTSNSWTITCQTPEGDVPFEDLLVPANGYQSGMDVLHTDTRLRYQFTASQGGHFLLSATESGTARLYLVASLVF
jgi:hypothetical protein